MFKFIRWLIGFCIFIAICLFALYCTICIVFPIKYIDTIEKYSQKYDLDPAFVCAIIGAMGLMQLMPATVDWAVEKIPIEDFSYDTIQEPETNIQIGCWVLNFLGNQFGENDELIAAAYNAGSGTVSKWLGDTKYSRDGEYLHYIPYEKIYSFMLGVGWFA